MDPVIGRHDAPGRSGKMMHALIRQNVKNFDEWKKVFDEHGSVRKMAGSMGGHMFRALDDPNNVFLLLEYEDLDKAKEFMNSDGLKETMKKAGVVGKPDIYLMDEGTRIKV
jgi:heme-degrading monooxygenase HmoA